MFWTVWTRSCLKCTCLECTKLNTDVSSINFILRECNLFCKCSNKKLDYFFNKPPKAKRRVFQRLSILQCHEIYWYWEPVFYQLKYLFQFRWKLICSILNAKKLHRFNLLLLIIYFFNSIITIHFKKNKRTKQCNNFFSSNCQYYMLHSFNITVFPTPRFEYQSA